MLLGALLDAGACSTWCRSAVRRSCPARSRADEHGDAGPACARSRWTSRAPPRTTRTARGRRSGRCWRRRTCPTAVRERRSRRSPGSPTPRRACTDPPRRRALPRGGFVGLDRRHRRGVAAALADLGVEPGDREPGRGGIRAGPLRPRRPAGAGARGPRAREGLAGARGRRGRARHADRDGAGTGAGGRVRRAPPDRGRGGRDRGGRARRRRAGQRRPGGGRRRRRCRPGRCGSWRRTSTTWTRGCGRRCCRRCSRGAPPTRGSCRSS